MCINIKSNFGSSERNCGLSNDLINVWIEQKISKL
jgi:hypothetical protein